MDRGRFTTAIGSTKEASRPSSGSWTRSGFSARTACQFNTLTCVHRDNARQPLDVYRFLRDEVGSTYMQFIPIVEYKGVRADGAAHVEQRRAAEDGDPGGAPGHPGLDRHRLVGRSRRLRLLPLPRVRPLGQPRRGEDPGQPLRDARRPARGTGLAALHLQRVLRQGRGGRARRRRLCLRPLRLSGVSARQHAGRTASQDSCSPARR